MHAHKLRIILCLCLAFFFALPPHFCYHSGAFSAEPSAPVVHTFDICIQPSAYRQLVSDVSEPNFPMQISVDSGPPTRGKIKLRGNSSKWIGLALPTQRIPVQIAFDGANPMDETIDNSCVKLINSFVPSRLLAEYMALDLFSFCGIPTPAHEFVFLRYNDVDFGLYLAVEDINENFLSKHFSLPFGSLLKGAEGDAGRPFTHSSWFGELRMDLDHGEERILSLLDALDRGQGYDKYLDIDEVLRFFACTAAYGGIGSILQEQSNFFLYDTGDKFILLPWDLSEAFSAEPTNNGIDRFRLEYWAAASPCALFDLLMQDDNNRKIYHAYLEEINHRFLDPEIMEPYFQSMVALVAPYLSRDHTMAFNLPFEMPVVQEEGYGTLGSLLLTLRNIHDNLAKQLNGSEHVFYVNPAWGNIPSEEDMNRRIDYFLQNSPAIDRNITNRICAGYPFYCLRLWGSRLAAENPTETAVAFIIFIVAFLAMCFFPHRTGFGSYR